jgi:hypothetical protein
VEAGSAEKRARRWRQDLLRREHGGGTTPDLTSPPRDPCKPCFHRHDMGEAFPISVSYHFIIVIFLQSLLYISDVKKCMLIIKYVYSAFVKVLEYICKVKIVNLKQNKKPILANDFRSN